MAGKGDCGQGGLFESPLRADLVGKDASRVDVSRAAGVPSRGFGAWRGGQIDPKTSLDKGNARNAHRPELRFRKLLHQ